MAFQSDVFQDDAFQVEEVVVLTATSTTTATFQRLIGKPLTATLATTATMQKLVRKTLAATAALVATLASVRVKFVEVITRQMPSIAITLGSRPSISITLRERENE